MLYNLKLNLVWLLFLLSSTYLFYKSTRKQVLVIVSILISISFLLTFTNFVYKNHLHPPEWDFLVFWLDGNVAVNGDNFYVAENYQKIELPYAPSDEFRGEIIDVGFKYPPFTMLLLWPLGLLKVSSAYLLWQTINLIFCFVCIYMLWTLFLHEYRLPGLFLVSALVLLFRPTFSSFYNAQTNFILVLFFLLLWRYRSTHWSGVWLAMCVLVKPYMAVLYLYPLFTRRWKLLIVAVFSLITLLLLSIAVFGWDVFFSFISNPVSKVPQYLYTEMVNQSLLATVTRLTFDWDFLGSSPLLNPLYLGSSLVLFLITAWVSIKSMDKDEWILLSILLLGLLVYPATLEHYGVFLIIPLLLLLRQSEKNKVETIIAFLIMLLVYVLVGFRQGGLTFFAIIFTWVGCILMAVKYDLKKIIPLKLIPGK